MSARAKAGLLGLLACGAVAIAGWALKETYTLGCEQARQGQAVEDLSADVREVKGDVKELLRRKP